MVFGKIQKNDQNEQVCNYSFHAYAAVTYSSQDVPMTREWPDRLDLSADHFPDTSASADKALVK